MNKNLKLFTSDQDRLAFEDSNSYERPYVSAVSGDAHFNKLITGTINNPAIGEVNVQNGDYFDRISLQKGLVIGGLNVNFLCFPFDVTFNEIREALQGYKINYLILPSELTMSAVATENGYFKNINGSIHLTEHDGNTLILAGTPILVTINREHPSSASIVRLTLTFKNKTIVINSSLTSTQTAVQNWYVVGNQFKCQVGSTGLSTANTVFIVDATTGQLMQSTNLSVTSATCSGWVEYRGPVPSE